MKKTNTFSRTTVLENKVKELEYKLEDLKKSITTSTISVEDTEETKRLRAIREKGGVKYGD